MCVCVSHSSNYNPSCACPGWGVFAVSLCQIHRTDHVLHHLPLDDSHLHRHGETVCPQTSLHLHPGRHTGRSFTAFPSSFVQVYWHYEVCYTNLIVLACLTALRGVLRKPHGISRLIGTTRCVVTLTPWCQYVYQHYEECYANTMVLAGLPAVRGA